MVYKHLSKWMFYTPTDWQEKQMQWLSRLVLEVLGMCPIITSQIKKKGMINMFSCLYRMSYNVFNPFLKAKMKRVRHIVLLMNHAVEIIVNSYLVAFLDTR